MSKLSIDLTEIEDLTLSSIMRKLNKKDSNEAYLFLKTYKKIFDKCYEKNIKDPEEAALKKTITFFVKEGAQIDYTFVKIAGSDTKDVSKYLKNIIQFILLRVPPDKRSKYLNNLKNKFNNLDPIEISSKKMPTSSALGQSITFVKHVLFGHNAKYVKEVLQTLSKIL